MVLKKYKILICLTASLMASVSTVEASPTKIINATISLGGNASYTIAVTLEHADHGWDHYANQWQVVGPNGDVIATRILAHPHVNEQPFTRSLSNIQIPEGISKITIKAGCTISGIDSNAFVLDVPH